MNRHNHYSTKCPLTSLTTLFNTVWLGFCLEFMLTTPVTLSWWPHTGSSLGCAPGCYAGGCEFETPTGPTLRVFRKSDHLQMKLQRQHFLLSYFVFSDKDDKREVPSHNSLNVDNSVGHQKTHALFEKRVGCCGCLSYVNGGVGETWHTSCKC